MSDLKSRVAKSLDLEPEQAEGLLRTLLQASREDLESLRRAVAAGQADGVASLAHHIKGAAANLEIEELRAPAARLEALGRQASLAGAEAELIALEAALRNLAAALP